MFVNKILVNLKRSIFLRNKTHLINVLTNYEKCHKFSTKSQISDLFVSENKTIKIFDKWYETDDWTNVNSKLLSFIGRNIYLKSGNPLYLLSESIRQFFRDYDCFVYENPVVDLKANFDSLLIPKDHVSRQKSDTYYVNKDYVLRSHTSAHQHHCLEKKSTSFICIADVYRRDEIDRSHHSVFHQFEAFRLYNKSQLIEKGIKEMFERQLMSRNESKQENHSKEAVSLIETEMKSTIEMFVKYLMGEEIEMRWISAYFPFTHPSWELEIYYNDKWLEILGCGIVEHQLLINGGHSDKIGWAFGMGLERLAMIRYKIPDIRLFWSTDSGFLCQFESANHLDKIVYKPISNYPQIFFDISFWLPKDFLWCDNDFHDVVRNFGEQLIEQVKRIDTFTNKEGITSHTYRIVYRSHERMLTKHELNVIHKNIESYVVNNWRVKIR